jgi:hypothetical protein
MTHYMPRRSTPRDTRRVLVAVKARRYAPPSRCAADGPDGDSARAGLAVVVER